MPRKKKEVIPTTISENDVWNMLEFARALSSGPYGTGILTPDLINARIKDISINTPISATEETLNSALANPLDSELALQTFGQTFELASQPYRRILGYLSEMLSFDLTFTVVNAKDDSEYKSKQYLKDLAIVETFLDKFDYVKEFRTVSKELLRNEAYFCCPRFDGQRYVLQELPASVNYTKITGRWDFGLLFSFNLYWFWLPGVDLRMYPPFFAKRMNEIWGGNNKPPMYDPSLSPDMRGDSSWVFWQDVPVDVGWAFKFSPEIGARIPYFAPLWKDLINQGTMRELQKNANIVSAYKLLVGHVGLLKDTKASLKDMITLSPELLGKFLGMVKAGLSDAVNLAVAPLENMSGVQFDGNNDLYSSYLKTSVSSSGINTGLVFAGDQKINVLESELSLGADENLMMQLYPQFNNFLNYHVNKLTSKYKFDFQFEGTNFFTNRNKRFDKAMALANMGIILPQKISAAIGMKPQEFTRQLAMAKADGFVDKLTPIITANKLNADVGRPQKREEDLTESGIQTRSDGGNIERGGKV